MMQLRYFREKEIILEREKMTLSGFAYVPLRAA